MDINSKLTDEERKEWLYIYNHAVGPIDRLNKAADFLYKIFDDMYFTKCDMCGEVLVNDNGEHAKVCEVLNQAIKEEKAQYETEKEMLDQTRRGDF